MKTIRITIQDKNVLSYDIYVGYDVLADIDTHIVRLGAGQRYVMITDTTVSRLYGDGLLIKLQRMGLDIKMLEIPAGESSKNIDTALALVRNLLELGLDRKSALIALGGGVVGDLTGFVASLYMRSIPYIQIPTTLVAQVDSSVGGKTAIDLDEGKNLLGTFHHPRVVLTDPIFLETLQENEFDNGIAEIIKYGIIKNEALFSFLEETMPELKKRNHPILVKTVELCCEIKKELVEIDAKDEGLRNFLNFGHTLGHALEAASEYQLSHGEGVAIGMVGAARLSEEVCGLPKSQRERIENLIKNSGLPTSITAHSNTDLVLKKMTTDKKKSGNNINFVLIKKIGEPFVTTNVTLELVKKTIERLKYSYDSVNVS